MNKRRSFHEKTPNHCDLKLYIFFFQGKQGLSGSKGAVPSAQSTVPQDMSSSLSAFFWKKEDSDLTHHGPTPGGLLGIRGHMPKLPSFKVHQ